MDIFGGDKHDFAPPTGRPTRVKADEEKSCDCPQTCAITKLLGRDSIFLDVIS